MFLLLKDKTYGMLFLSQMCGYIIAIQYCLILFNLTSISSPHVFPESFHTYPNVTDPTGQFFIPVYLKSAFLRENLEWTSFFGIDVEDAQINNIWFDFANLALLTIYFFSYGSPITTKNVKVSFSQTKSLETALHEYAQIQIEKKAKLKLGNDIDIQRKYEDDFQERLKSSKRLVGIDEKDKDLNVLKDDFSEIAANNTIELQQGATVYLNKLKSSIYLFGLVKNGKYVMYIGLNILTIIMVFMLAYLNKTFMSLVYLAFCVPMILQMNNFFFQEELSIKGKRWQQPYLISGPLLIFSFIDISLQMLNQIPFSQHESKVFVYFGFEKIYHITNPVEVAAQSNGTVTAYEVFSQGDLVNINYSHLMLLIFKCFNLFFIFMQMRVYESDSFQKFMKRDLRRLITLANTQKIQALTYRFNNWKLQKIAASQANKKKIMEGVAQLKLRIKLWEETVFGRFHHKSHEQSKLQLQMPANQIPLLAGNPKEDNLTPGQLKSQSSSLEPLAEADQTHLELHRKRSSAVKSVKFVNTTEEKLGKGILRSMSLTKEQKDAELLEKVKIFNNIRTKLPRCARFNLYLYDNYINKILFISDYERAYYIKKEMQKGSRAIYCFLETQLWNEITLLYHTVMKQKFKLRVQKPTNKKKQKEEIPVEDEVTLQDLPESRELMNFWNLSRMNSIAICEAIVSNFSAFAYLSMILSMIISAGWISILYPFAVFGYALIEETRPGKYFWDVMIKYTLFVLFMKFIFQLDVWLEFEGLPDLYTSINNWALFGLWRCSTTGELFCYILPEVLVLFCILGQNYYEILLGVYTKKEPEVENIIQARTRYLKARMGKKGSASTTIMQNKEQIEKRIIQEELDELGLNYKQRMQEQKEDLQLVKEAVDRQEERRFREEIDSILKDHAEDQKNADIRNDIEEFTPVRRYSLIDDVETRIDQVKTIKKEKKGGKARGFVNRNFGKNQYFKRIFPTIKEQKPGVDYYASITGVQFLICWFLISYYTYLDTEGTQNLEESSQFSWHMVVVLFIQILVMVLERYINRTNTKVVLRKIGMKKNELELDEEAFYSKLKQDKVEIANLSLRIEHAKTSDEILQNSIESGAIRSEPPRIILEETKMSPQQVTKFFLQHVLLIVNHILIFWYFPLNSNYAIYGTPYCNSESSMYAQYGCLSFKKNAGLIIFYLLFCWYFVLSAYQLRYGLPDERKSTSLQKNYSGFIRYRWLIYYNLPFVVELKSMLDWCFSKTAIDLFQWIQLNVFQSEMYLAKVSGKNTFAKKYGDPTSKKEKCFCGCICLNIFAFFLLGPFIIFSNLSFISSDNLVTNALISMKVKFYNQETRDSYSFPLYMGTNPLNMDVITEQYYEDHQFGTNPNTKFFEYDQIQLIKMRNSSEMEWSLSREYEVMFQNLLAQTLEKGNNTMQTTVAFSYSFTRPYPTDVTVATGTVERKLDPKVSDDYDILQALYTAAALPCLTDQTATAFIILQDFLVTELRLTQNVDVLIMDGFVPKNLTMSYTCQNYWSLNINGAGIVFTTFSDLIANNLFSSTSILAFYFSVSYIVGTYFRSLFMYKGDRVFIVDSPYTDAMLNLFEAIQMMRLEKNIKKEEEYFHIVIEVLRSPELLKHLCGSHLREPL